MTVAAFRFGMEGVERVGWKGPRLSRWIVLIGLALIVTYTASTLLDLALPPPTGDHAVGRASWVWVDDSRPESHTPDTPDVRSVPVRAWYPAQPGTGQPAGYVEDPFSNTARSVMVTTRALVSAFFDQWLREPRSRPFSGLDVPSDVYINVYPLGDNRPIPVEVS